MTVEFMKIPRFSQESTIMNEQSREDLVGLLQAGHSTIQLETEDELLDSILCDAVRVLDAQRGAIVLFEGPEKHMKIRSLANGLSEGQTDSNRFSQKIAQRCIARGASFLCECVREDPELAAAQSIADGVIDSVLCVLLRIPSRPLGVLHVDRTLWQRPFTEEDLQLANSMAAHVSKGIEAAALLRDQPELFLNAISELAARVEKKEVQRTGHIWRVTNYALMLGRQLGLAPADLDLLEKGAPLHDIGKIAIDDAILRKPGPLTPAEFEVMKTHTTKGAKIIGKVPELRPITPIVLSHHERWDGSGYPDGLKGEDIPLLARVVAVANAFDVMTRAQPYRLGNGKPVEEAFAEVERMAGSQFDPQCAAAFLAIREEIVEVMKSEG
jgi:putative nucleotidyltransferase with HDIG domain